MTVIGIDPGANTSIAVVSQEWRGGPWRLERLYRVHGETWPTWSARLALTLERVGEMAAPPQHVFIEAGTKMRAGAARRSDTMAALGERRGAAMYAAHAAGLTMQMVTPSEWATLVRVRVGKLGSGQHRIAEAGVVLGAAEALAEIPASARVDAAEAVLIAAAGCVHRWGGYAA